MLKASSKKTQAPHGWCPSESCNSEFEAGIDPDEKHSGTRSAYLKSVVSIPKTVGNLTQAFIPREYVGKRLKMSAWVKTKITKGTAQLCLQIDGDWHIAAEKKGCFDNMDDRPIKGTTDWTQYDLVVEVPETSTLVVFGLTLLGEGQIWLDDVSFETVGKDVELTGKYSQPAKHKTAPVNLSFEEDG